MRGSHPLKDKPSARPPTGISGKIVTPICSAHELGTIYEVEISICSSRQDPTNPLNMQRNFAFRSHLKFRIGEQKIDVLFIQPGDNRPIILDVKRKMIRL
jgi:hypothetical protein